MKKIQFLRANTNGPRMIDWYYHFQIHAAQCKAVTVSARIVSLLLSHKMLSSHILIFRVVIPRKQSDL